MYKEIIREDIISKIDKLQLKIANKEDKYFKISNDILKYISTLNKYDVEYNAYILEKQLIEEEDLNIEYNLKELIQIKKTLGLRIKVLESITNALFIQINQLIILMDYYNDKLLQEDFEKEQQDYENSYKDFIEQDM